MKRPSHRPSEEEAIAATAAAWLAQRDGGLSADEESDFRQWREADRRHEAAVGRLEATWSALQQLREFRSEARLHPDPDLLRHPVSRRIIPFPAIASAGALAAALALAAAWWFSPTTDQRQAAPATTYATTFDGYQRVLLGDGSVVELNGNSEVKVQFTPAERTVRLVRGEAHFTVASNPTWPFWVEAGTVSVRAVGTAFKVRLGAQDVEVLVTHGKVAVAQDPISLSSHPVVTRPVPGIGESDRIPEATTLVANERIVIPALRKGVTPAAIALPAIEKVAPDFVREALAWQEPRLVFVDTPLAEAVSQFNRRNQVQIELDDAVSALPISGSFRAENVDALVRLLVIGGDVTIERPAPTRILLRKARPEPPE